MFGLFVLVRLGVTSRFNFRLICSDLDEDNRSYQLERAQRAANRAIGAASSRGRESRGGRGRGRGRRGGRGGRGGGRDSNRSRGKEKEAVDESAAEAGDKRKRGVEPDGGITEGVRGNAAKVPVFGAAKKVKVDVDSS